MIPFPKKKYEIIYADPPWSYNDTLGGNAKMGAMPYDTMTQDEINALPLKEITGRTASCSCGRQCRNCRKRSTRSARGASSIRPAPSAG